MWGDMFLTNSYHFMSIILNIKTTLLKQTTQVAAECGVCGCGGEGHTHTHNTSLHPKSVPKTPGLS